MRMDLGSLGQWLGGGLAGAVLALAGAFYLSRPTTVTYNVTTTTLGADPTVRSIVPDLRIQIGATEVPVIHVHAIEISAPRGRFIEKADLAIQWETDVVIYGNVFTEAPSLSHKVSCQTLQRGATCTLMPIIPKLGPYRISLATNQQRFPNVYLLAKDADLVKAEVYAARRSMSEAITPILAGALTVGILLAIQATIRLKRLQKEELLTKIQLEAQRQENQVREALERLRERIPKEQRESRKT